MSARRSAEGRASASIKPASAPDGKDGQRVEERPCVGAELRGTGEDSGSYGFWHLIWKRREHLGHEERVPRGQPVKLVGICEVRIGEYADSVARQRPHPDAADSVNRGQASEDDAKRVGPAKLVVAIRRDDQRIEPLDPAGEEPNDVERALVGPVDVFQHDDRGRRPGELLDERVRKAVRVRTAANEVVERSADRPRDVDERSQRPRHEERVARSREHRRALRHLRAETPQESALADARLACDEHETSGPCAYLGEATLEHGKLVLPLEQVRLRRSSHSWIVIARPTECKGAPWT